MMAILRKSSREKVRGDFREPWREIVVISSNFDEDFEMMDGIGRIGGNKVWCLLGKTIRKIRTN